METIINEIVRKLHDLPDSKIIETLDFVKSLSLNQALLDSQGISKDNIVLDDNSFEVIADQLSEELAKLVGNPIPLLSDYGVSRAGIYEDHP